jgi:photosystem II stability/assembly factor-like uncharacterized protein
MLNILSVLTVLTIALSPLRAQQWKLLVGPTYTDSLGNLAAVQDFRKVICTDQQHLFIASEKQGVFLTVDRGDTWRCVYKLGDTNTLYDLCTTAEGLVGGATARGFLFSSDNGETWDLRGFSTLRDTINAVAFGANGGVIARRYEARGWTNLPRLLWRSSDNGMTWLPIDTLKSLRAELGRTSDGRVLASTTEPEGIVGVGALWVTTDNGITWERQNLPLYIGYSYAVVVSPKDQVLIASYEDDGVYLSGEDLAHWRTIIDPTYHVDIHNFAFRNECLVYFNATQTYSSCDGYNWDTLRTKDHVWSGIEAFNTLFGFVYTQIYRLEDEARVTMHSAGSTSFHVSREGIKSLSDETITYQVIDLLGRVCEQAYEVSSPARFERMLDRGTYVLRTRRKGTWTSQTFIIP